MVSKAPYFKRLNENYVVVGDCVYEKLGKEKDFPAIELDFSEADLSSFEALSKSKGYVNIQELMRTAIREHLPSLEVSVKRKKRSNKNKSK